jgi:hypothetical protein
VRRHGADAEAVAQRNADAADEAQNSYAKPMWKLVIKAIRDIQKSGAPA